MKEIVEPIVQFTGIPLLVPFVLAVVSYFAEKNSSLVSPTQGDTTISTNFVIRPNLYKHTAFAIMSHAIWGITTLTSSEFLKTHTSNFWILYLLLILWSFVIILHVFHPDTSFNAQRFHILSAGTITIILRSLTWAAFCV